MQSHLPIFVLYLRKGCPGNLLSHKDQLREDQVVTWPYSEIGRGTGSLTWQAEPAVSQLSNKCLGAGTQQSPPPPKSSGCAMILSPTERVMNHWQEDLMFGYQFLNGCNPVLIQRCTKLPEKLPVTTEMVECSLERQLTLEQEVEVRPGWLEMVVQARGSAQMSG